MNIHVAIGEEKKGPFSEEEIREKVKSGLVKPDALAWKSGMDDWVPLRELVSDLPAPKGGGDAPQDLPAKKPSGPLYAVVERFWDGLLGKLDWLFSEKAFNGISKYSTLAGFYALPVGTVLSVIYGIIAAVKFESLTVLVMFGFGYAVLLSILNYSALKMIPALDKLITNSETNLGTPAFLNSLSLVFFIGGVGLFIGGLFGAIKGENLIPLIIGAVFLFFGIQWVTFCRNPKLLNIRIDESLGAGDEFLGLISFFFKSWLKMLPIYFGLIVALVVIGQIVGLGLMFNGDMMLFGSATYSLAGVAALPLITYLLFLGYYFGIEILRAVLSLLHIQRAVEK